MSASHPVGIFDSGVGGLSVWQPLRALLPAEHFVYFADSAHLPYGEKTPDQLRGYAAAITTFLRAQSNTISTQQPIKALVIACNSANAFALNYLRELHPDLPIIGMEPALKPAVAATQTGVIAVLMTRATAQGMLYASVVDRFAVPSGVQILPIVCPAFVDLAERGVPDDAKTRHIVAETLAPVRAANVDQLVLACTHFPFLISYIQAELGDTVTIIDPAPAVARQTARVLNQYGISALQGSQGTDTFYTSGDPVQFAATAELLTGHEAVFQNVTKVVL